MNTISFIYLRFIDNIFYKWTSNKKGLAKFLNKPNIKYPSTKFEYEIPLAQSKGAT